jgi:hypothetical protein
VYQNHDSKLLASVETYFLFLLFLRFHVEIVSPKIDFRKEKEKKKKKKNVILPQFQITHRFFKLQNL